MVLRVFQFLLAPFLAVGLAQIAQAETYTVTVAPAANLGTIVSAPSGSTTYRVTANTGAVAVVSGTATRMTTASLSPMLVTVSCDNTSGCTSGNVSISIAATGSPTNRAGALTSFTVTTNTAVLATQPTGTSTVTFTINPVGRSSSKSFYVGYNFPVLADNSGKATGVSTSLLSITASASSSTSGVGTGTVSATVIRPITLTSSTALSFGRLVLPASGSQTVTYDPAVGSVTVTGAGSGATVLSSPAPSYAGFAVAGEGGQAFTLTVPSSFALNGPSGSTPISINTLPSSSGAQTLSSTAGSAGSFNFTVGGSFPVSSTTMGGSYSGSFAATVQYN